MELINPITVVEILRKKVNSQFSYVTDPGLENEKFAKLLFNLITSKFWNRAELTEEITLDFGDINEAGNVEEEVLSQTSSQSSSEEPGRSSSTDPGQSSSDYNIESSPVKRHKRGPPVQEDTLKNIAHFVLVQGKTYAAAARKFSKTESFVKRICKESQTSISQGTSRDTNQSSSQETSQGTSQGTSAGILRTPSFTGKIKIVKEFMKSSFESARERGDVVHYWNLQNWASEAARKIGFDFKISSTFLNNFKRDNNIVTRKITKYLTDREVVNEVGIKQAGIEFVNKVNHRIRHEGLNHDCVWNSDQSGFEYEMKYARTLSQKGEKDTWARCQSTNSLTHSYTIQIHTSLAGKLGKKIYICFQEKSGTFGPLVRASLERNTPSNVSLDASSSGKMTKDHFKRWFQNVFAHDVPDTPNKSLLLLDSWSGQTDRAVSELLPNKNVSFEYLPPKTTKYVQPLDVYFFRQYKPFIRRIENQIKAEENLRVKLSDRRFIIRMHSCVYNQFNNQRNLKACFYMLGRGPVIKCLKNVILSKMQTKFYLIPEWLNAILKIVLIMLF